MIFKLTKHLRLRYAEKLLLLNGSLCSLNVSPGLDDGWMSHYGDFTFNSKFPDPKGMSDEVHKLGYRFGLWVTLWINLDADNYQVAASKGYLLKSKTDPSQPCPVPDRLFQAADDMVFAQALELDEICDASQMKLGHSQDRVKIQFAREADNPDDVYAGITDTTNEMYGV